MPESHSANFKSFPWHFSYKTSSAGSDGRQVDILHDFYIPALTRSIRYDRVAGYFRSSSLAVASQGFSAFTQTGGGMRMVVGADMNPADVSAVLKGDCERLASKLTLELNQISLWPKDVENGVTLLAWMVAKGILDIRIAFRVHGQTGQPLPFDAVEDGYVHEKWAVFTDAEDNRLYVSESLNESKTALVHNAENIDVHADWWGNIERRRANEAQTAFETLWNNTNPHIRTLTLPEAIQKKLVDMGNTFARPMDLVDEAHYARRRNPKNGIRLQPKFGNLYRTISENIRSKTPCLWMATATPMQLDWIEVFDLLTLTRRVGAFQFDPSITWAYYQALGRLVQGGNIDNDAWEMLRRTILSLKRQYPLLWDYLGKTVIDGQMIMAVRLWLEHCIIPKGLDRRKILRLIFLAFPTYPLLWDYLGKTVIDGQMIMAVRLWLEHCIPKKSKKITK